MTEEDFRRDFISYSGGFTPDEAWDEMRTYIEAEAFPGDATRDQIEVFFDKWLEELEEQ